MSNVNNLFVKQVTIANTETESSVCNLLGEFSLIGMRIPASWTACDITFEISMEDPQGTPADFAVSADAGGTDHTVTTTSNQDRYIGALDIFVGNFVKLVCSTAQLGNRTVDLILRRID